MRRGEPGRVATHQSRGHEGPATGMVGPPSGGKIHVPGRQTGGVKAGLYCEELSFAILIKSDRNT